MTQVVSVNLFDFERGSLQRIKTLEQRNAYTSVGSMWERVKSSVVKSGGITVVLAGSYTRRTNKNCLTRHVSPVEFFRVFEYPGNHIRLIQLAHAILVTRPRRFSRQKPYQHNLILSLRQWQMFKNWGQASDAPG